MKKCFLVIAILFLYGNNKTFSTGTIKVGYDFGGSYTQTTLNFDVSATDMGNGISFSADLFVPLGKYCEIGAGVEYQSPREVEFFGSTGKFNFIPLFVIFRLILDFLPQFSSFVSARVGYNFFTGNNDFAGTGIYRSELSGGATWGVGFGFILGKMILLELSFSKHHGEATIPATIYGFPLNSDIEYSKFGTYLGFCF